LSTLSREDMHTYVKLLETLRDKALECAYSGTDIQEINSYETKDVSSFMKRLPL